ncbi:MAG: InlB B-repeat-containing protein [Clostridia bacterium]|nr:InlB B-repeat-containing protein [Clostridia bacterium]
MKRLLSLVALMLMLSCVLASCTIIEGFMPKDPEPSEQEQIKHFTVTFDLDGGVAPEDFAESVTVNEGETVTLPTPTKENHVFLGWYLDGELFSKTTPITANIALKAGWEQNNIYTITYNTGDKATVENEVFIKGEIPEIPETPKAEGYVFFGWYLDEELTERYFFDYAFDSDLTLYAKFYDTSLGEYIVISNYEQLMAISNQPDAKYLLACDINCRGENLTPITNFSGELEGNGYKIFNFEVNSSATQAGFILNNSGVIRDLTFENFTYDVINSSSDECCYGVITANNSGKIENCKVLNGEIKFTCTNSKYNKEKTDHIGAISGENSGEIINCMNAVEIVYSGEITALGWLFIRVAGIVGYCYEDSLVKGCVNEGKITIYSYAYAYYENIYSCIGGIVGFTNNNSVIEDCANLAEMYVECDNPYFTEYAIGGVIGYNMGKANRCYSDGNVNFLANKTNRDGLYYIGGFSGWNLGEIRNAYSAGDITLCNSKGGMDYAFGGFVGKNQGKLLNCYSSTNITDTGAYLDMIGGFVGANETSGSYTATINKCFSTGSITLGSVPANIGCFAAKSTGTLKDCYYLDTMTLTVVIKAEITEGETTETVETIETIEPSCTVGEAKAFEELTSVDFIENTLYFDRMIWFVTEGKLPTLR